MPQVNYKPEFIAEVIILLAQAWIVAGCRLDCWVLETVAAINCLDREAVLVFPLLVLILVNGHAVRFLCFDLIQGGLDFVEHTRFRTLPDWFFFPIRIRVAQVVNWSPLSINVEPYRFEIPNCLVHGQPAEDRNRIRCLRQVRFKAP